MRRLTLLAAVRFALPVLVTVFRQLLSAAIPVGVVHRRGPVFIPSIGLVAKCKGRCRYPLEAVLKTTALGIAVLRGDSQCSCASLYTPLARRRAPCSVGAHGVLKQLLRNVTAGTSPPC
jgi:hypothetical protein